MLTNDDWSNLASHISENFWDHGAEFLTGVIHHEDYFIGIHFRVDNLGGADRLSIKLHGYE